MYDEHIKMINEWFDKHEDYGTYHVDDEYAVRIGDMRDFRDLIAEKTETNEANSTRHMDGWLHNIRGVLLQILQWIVAEKRLAVLPMVRTGGEVGMMCN